MLRTIEEASMTICCVPAAGFIGNDGAAYCRTSGCMAWRQKRMLRDDYKPTIPAKSLEAQNTLALLDDRNVVVKGWCGVAGEPNG